ncbi:hypothetical protein CAAU_1669 [Caloramator australicus RC3]|uniref:Uncharacterized protein n=1 Tax=Caloramator australicus RC3 TaxID=857293 RepID=I7KUX1_9CLOT|nr:hypothetical protein CAAU_1669 [Caloramator australicus RC3]
MNNIKEIESMLKECKSLDEFYRIKNKIMENERKKVYTKF